MGVGVVGLGMSVPRQVVNNRTVAAWAATTTEWIENRTGVLERRYASPGVVTSDLGAAAVRACLLDAGVAAGQVGVVVVATSTPDQPQPATAVHVQRKAGLPAGAAFDVNAVCSGFIYGLVTAAGLLQMGPGNEIAVCVGADIYSRIMNRADRKTVSLFGDGAGAVAMTAVPDGYGLLGHSLTADGSTADYVRVPAGGSAMPASEGTVRTAAHTFHMDGRAVRDFALTTVPKTVEDALSSAGVTVDEIDRVIIHQGNVNLVRALGRELGVPDDKLAFTADMFGNTAAASISLTLAHSHQRSPLRRDELVLLASIGGGMTTGAAVLRWR